MSRRCVFKAKPAVEAVLCADIFPVNCNEIAPLLGRGLHQRHALRSLRGSLQVTQKKELQSRLTCIEALNVSGLRQLVLKRGWNVGAGGNVALTGRGRTRDAILADVLRNVEEEEDDAVNQAAATLDVLSVSTQDTIFAIGTDLSSLPLSPAAAEIGWVTGGKVMIPPTALAKLAAIALQRMSTQENIMSLHGIEVWREFVFRDLVIYDETCIEITVRNSLRLSSAINLDCIAPRVGKNEERLLQGMSVFLLPDGHRGCIVSLRGLLSDDLRRELLNYKLKDDTRQAILSARIGEPCWYVQTKQGATLTYLASRLQPTLSRENLDRMQLLGKSFSLAIEKLRRFCILCPQNRRTIVDLELQRLMEEAPTVAKRLFPQGIARINSEMPPFRRAFSIFKKPYLIVGNDSRIPPTGASIWRGLTSNGLFRYSEQVGKSIQLRSYLLDSNPKPEMSKFAMKQFSKVLECLRSLKFHVQSPEHVTVKKSVASVLEDTNQAHSIVIFGNPISELTYFDAKREFLQHSAPSLTHTATQFINLRRLSWYACANIALQLVAKLGHTPYVLQSPTEGMKHHKLICGVDVCQLVDKQSGKLMHTVACAQFLQVDGKIEFYRMLQRCIDGESVPAAVWSDFMSSNVCAGRDVTIHRDGRFTNEEREFLAKHAKHVDAKRGRFALVEVIKWSNGVPRLYHGKSNPPSGMFLRLSDADGLLSTNTTATGSVRPLRVRVDASGPLSIEGAAEEVFQMSHLNYRNLWKKPRLPATLYQSHVAAFFHSCLGEKHRNSGPCWLQSHGTQQYWL